MGLNVPEIGSLYAISYASGVNIQCVSRMYPGVYPGCIMGKSLINIWVYLGVFECIQGEVSAVSMRVTRVVKGLHPSARDRRAWMCQVDPIYTISTPPDTP